ncbi:MAG: divergent polysaccharide deacetylase family protein, partial [Albidovulum sp.]
AADFTNAEGKPLMAVMLFDIGVEAGGLGVDALAALPFAVTIAIDPERPDAGRAAAAYRAAGSEVAIFARNLPVGASASDLEVAFQIYQRALPEAVAYTGAVTAEFQRNARMAQHLTQLLGMNGLGLVGYDQGLNPGRRAAERANIPHASIDRLFDQADGGFGSLARELDRATFTAAQKGSYLIALPASPEAVAALVDWAGGPAASSIALAPVSAVMAETQGAN